MLVLCRVGRSADGASLAHVRQISLIGKSRIWSSLIHQRLSGHMYVLSVGGNGIYAPCFRFQNIETAANTVTKT